MTRLQKKCFIAVAGSHLLLVVVVLCSGFITSKPVADDNQVLDVIPANLIDKALTSGVRGAPPPPVSPATPPLTKPPEPKPPETVQPQVVKTPDPELPKPDKVQPHKELDLSSLKKITRKNTTPDNSAAEAERVAKETKRLQDAKIRAIHEATRSIKDNTSSTTTVDLPGDSSASYANYATIVKSVYTHAWTLPDDTSSDDANVKISVTIANTGKVIEAHIVDRSGDKKVDGSVQRALDRVSEIAPFPDGSTDKQRTYIINFNLKAKRMLG